LGIHLPLLGNLPYILLLQIIEKRNKDLMTTS